MPFKKPGWGLAVNFANFITWSDDYGKTWHATQPVGARGWNECFIAVLPGNHSSVYSVLEIARRVRPDSSVPPPYAYPPHTYAAVRFSADFQTRSPIVTLDPHVETPVCEGSLLVHGNDVYFSHPQSTSSRTNLTIHKSEDGGRTFNSSVLIWGEGSGYSALTEVEDGLGIAFNQWPNSDPKSSRDGPGQYIRFVRVPWTEF